MRDLAPHHALKPESEHLIRGDAGGLGQVDEVADLRIVLKDVVGAGLGRGDLHGERHIVLDRDHIDSGQVTRADDEGCVPGDNRETDHLEGVLPR